MPVSFLTPEQERRYGRFPDEVSSINESAVFCRTSPVAFSPRIADIGGARFWRIDPKAPGELSDDDA